MKTRQAATLLQYGADSELANKAASAGLTVTKVRAVSQKDMVDKFGLTTSEAKILCDLVRRKPIDDDVTKLLLERSNFLCCVCKGSKSVAYMIHHIVEYEKTQDNAYRNLAVLCPADHDLAHQGGLTLRLTADQIRGTKDKWEKQVEIQNAQRAARKIEVDDDAIDYVNVKRIEELCVRLFKKIPKTTITKSLRRAGILGINGSFDQKFVRSNLSNGRYLFDYITHSETEHYKQLLQRVADVVDFVDLDVELSGGYAKLKPLEGSYAFFIGGVCAKRPRLPITNKTPPVLLHYSRKPVRIEWILDPNFFMSMSAIVRVGGKNRYIVYCLVRTVRRRTDGTILVRASPLLVAQPTKYVHKAPAIAYQRQYERYVYAGLVEDE